MPTPDRVDALIRRVLENAHVRAIEEFYHVDATMQENLGAPRGPREALVAAERKLLQQHKAVDSRVVEPVFVSGDHVVIQWVFEFTRRDDTVMRIEELAHQTWRGDRIATERFYYDPVQLGA